MPLQHLASQRPVEDKPPISSHFFKTAQAADGRMVPNAAACCAACNVGWSAQDANAVSEARL